MAAHTRIDAPASGGAPLRASGLPTQAQVVELEASMDNLTVNSADHALEDNSSEDDEHSAESPTEDKKKKKKKKKKSKASTKLGGDVALAYSSASNIKYPAFELDVLAMIQKMQPREMMQLHEPDGDPRQFLQSIGLPGARQRMPAVSPQQLQVASTSLASASSAADVPGRLSALFPEGEDRVAFFGFGGSDDGTEPWSYVVADAYSRLFFKGHPMDSVPLRIEPHISKIPLRIVDVPRRGKALVATRPIPAGTAFLNEPPLLLSLQTLDALTVANFERVTQPMHAKCAAAYDSLLNCKPYAGPLVSNRHGILRTNGFKATFAENLGDRVFSAVMQIMSRANHSCAPNTEYSWDWKHYHATYTALRDIAVGEEITVSYIDEGRPKAERRKELKTKYLFTCTCERCGPA